MDSSQRVRGTYTADWFTHLAGAWQSRVRPALGASPVRWLEVGSYEGLSALWVLDNLLPPGSTVTCVDHFDRDYEARFDANVAGEPRILKQKGKSRDVLLDLAPGFAGAYVDASHEYEDVLEDARLVWPLVQLGAVVVFDDAGMPQVGAAVDAFLAEATGAREAHRSWQAFIEKVIVPGR